MGLLYKSRTMYDTTKQIETKLVNTSLYLI